MGPYWQDFGDFAVWENQWVFCSIWLSLQAAAQRWSAACNSILLFPRPAWLRWHHARRRMGEPIVHGAGGRGGRNRPRLRCHSSYTRGRLLC